MDAIHAVEDCLAVTGEALSTPWPLLVAAGVLLAAGAVLLVRRSRAAGAVAVVVLVLAIAIGTGAPARAVAAGPCPPDADRTSPHRSHARCLDPP